MSRRRPILPATLRTSPALAFIAIVAACSSGGNRAPGTHDEPDFAPIGPAGGVLTAFDGEVSFTVPAGSLTEETTITVARETPPGGDILAVWEFGPDGLTFEPGATLEVAVDTLALPDSVDPSALRLAHYVPEEDLALVPHGADAPKEGLLQSPVSHFSQRAVAHYRCEDVLTNPSITAELQSVATPNGATTGNIVLTWFSDRTTPVAPATIEFARVVNSNAPPIGDWLRLRINTTATGTLTVPVTTLGTTWCTTYSQGMPTGCAPDRGAFWYFRVRAQCSAQVAGPPSEPVRVAWIGPDRAPNTPQVVTATPQSATTARIEWVGDEYADCYEIHRDGQLVAQVGGSTGAFLDGTTPPPGLNGGCPAATPTAPPLVAGQSATWCVRAGNHVGWSSEQCASANLPTTGAPNPPMNFSATLKPATNPNLGPTVQLTWIPGGSQDGTPYKQRLTRSVDGGALMPYALLGAATSSYDDSGVTPGTTLRYQLSAENQNGSSAVVEVTVAVPGTVQPPGPTTRISTCAEMELRVTPGEVTVPLGQSATVTVEVVRTPPFEAYVYLSQSLVDCDGTCDATLAFCDGPGPCQSSGAFFDEAQTTMTLEVTAGTGSGVARWRLTEAQHPSCSVELVTIVPVP